VKTDSFPGFRLGTFYFLFFAAVGGFLPYWSLYLESLGFDATTIGSLMALMMATRIVAPNLWGWLADRRGRRLGVIRTGAWVAVACFAVVPLARDPVPLALLIVAYSVFWAAVLPQFEAVTLGHLGSRSARYSIIRLWGSVGFVLASAAIGPALDVTGTGALPWMLLLLMASVAVMSFLVAEPPADARSVAEASTSSALPVVSMACLMLSCALMQASHGPYYVFFSIHLESLGYPRGQIGMLWSLAVVAEVALFAAMPRLLAAAPHVPLFAGCFALTALRWLLLALAPATLPVLILVQVLHAVSFGAHHALAMALLHRLFRGGRQGRGQALYSSLSFGAGGAAGSAAAGWIWASAGPDAAWLTAAALAAAGGLVALGIRAGKAL
jgi:PPP family 3-phenylpropionic acid transporter